MTDEPDLPKDTAHARDLLESLHMLEDIVDNAIEAFVLLRADGLVRYANPAAERSLGIEHPLRGYSFAHLPFTTLEPRWTERNLSQAIHDAAKGEASSVHDVMFIEGQEARFLEFLVTPLEDPHGDDGMLVEIRDDPLAHDLNEKRLARNELTHIPRIRRTQRDAYFATPNPDIPTSD